MLFCSITVTLDVLKCMLKAFTKREYFGITVTLDVLKWHTIWQIAKNKVSITVTLDVLKLSERKKIATIVRV